MKSVLKAVLCVMTLVLAMEADAQVIFKETVLTIPTYETGDPEPNPVFYTPESYQLAQMHIYPYPYIGYLSDKKVNREYKALILENEYISICVLPELGGRLYTAVDRTNGYDFIYRNRVIKPALIGMTGAWLSGGVEWNIPHHHRASTFMPVDYRVEEHPDGGRTIWVGEYEKRHNARWAVGLTLRPGKAYIETTMKHFNTTPIAQNILMFANTAIHTHENYQVVFPPDVERTAFHAKLEFCDWPIARQYYRGIDFTKGVDVSWWKNISAPTSFFAWDTKMDFMAGIDHEKHAGTLLVGDHTVFTGKKVWYWGNNEVQRLWDQMLTDEDGPYLELMMGLYSDSQPDYSWNSPFSTHYGTFYYIPIRNMTHVKNANRDFAVNLDVREREIGIEVNATSVFEDAKITLMLGGQALFERNVSLSPGKAFVQRIMIENAVRPQELKLVVQTSDGHGIVYSPPEKKDRPLPEVYRRPDSPETFGSADVLFLAGSRLEQYGDPNLDPVKYYEEALKRDPRHVFANTGLGVWYLKKDLYHKAEPYLRTAVGQVTGNYTRARYGEPLYYLGLCLYLLGREEEAIEILGQAAWNREWASQAFTLTGVMACSGGDLDAACDLFLKAMEADGTNTEARVFRAVVLRRLGKKEKALELIDEVLSFDPLNLLALYERGLLSGVWGGRPDVEQKRILDHFREEPDNYLETAAKYRMLGFDREAVNILSAGAGRSEKLSLDPMIQYYLGYFYNRLGEKENSGASYLQASKLPLVRCFPHGTASMSILEAVLEKNPRDAAAHYLLGNVLADNDPERAVKEWSLAIALDPKKAVYYRNMAYIEANVLDRMEEALTHIEKAVQLNPSDPRTLYEADVYAEYADVDPELRLQKLAKYPETVKKWDKLQLRDISLRNIAGFHDEAIDKLKSNHFYVAEGTHINPHSEWTNAHLYRGIDRLASGKNHQALADFRAIFEFPRNLETTADNKTAVAYYWMGKCWQALSDSSQAVKAFEELSGFRNKQGWGGTGTPLVQFFKGLALVELGESGKADTVFQRLFIQGRDGMDEKPDTALDLKGVRVRQDQKNRRTDAFFSMALGLLGKGELEQAEIMMNKVTETDPSRIDARWFLDNRKTSFFR